MTKFSQKQLRALVESGVATDLSAAADTARLIAIRDTEGFAQIGYVAGAYGCSGMLLKSLKSDKLYALIGRVANIYLV